ncbi:MAG TPA: hypothetical protein PLY23_00835 [Alphaproteobacteria bacterium]|nr:hypothetical protein [Alphaproteobacteria bacterium]
MKNRMLPFYFLTPSAFAVVSGLGLNFHPASGMTEEELSVEKTVHGHPKKGALSPVLEEGEDREEDGFLQISRDLFPSNLDEVLTLSDIRKALNYSPDMKELMSNPHIRVDYQPYIESLMIKMMQFTGWKINKGSTFSSSYFYADESVVSEALKRERARVLTLKGREAQKLEIFISQMENLERFLKSTTQTSMSANELPSLMPADIEKNPAWMGGASYLTHSTHLAFLVAPDAIEETLEIFSLLQKAFEKLQAAYTQLSTTLSAKVINPILKSRLLSTDRESPLQAWSQLLKANQDYYEKTTTADLQEPINPLLNDTERLSISPPPSAFLPDDSSPAKKAGLNLSPVQEEGGPLPSDPFSPASSEGNNFSFEINESDEDAPGVISTSLDAGNAPVSQSEDIIPSPLARTKITSLDHGPTLDPDNEFEFTGAIDHDGESMAPPSDDENSFEEIPRVPTAHLTDLAPAVGDLTSTTHPENRPHPASPALGVQNDLSVPVDASASVDSPSEPLSDAVLPPVGEASPLGDNAENALSDFEDVSSLGTASALHSPARSLAESPVLVAQNDLSVPDEVSSALSSPSSDVLSVHAPTPGSEISPLEVTENDLKEFEQVASSEAVSAPHSPARSSADSPALEGGDDLFISVDASADSTSEPLSETALPSVGKDSPIVASGENDLDAFEQVPSSVAISAPHSPARSSADSPALEGGDDLFISVDASADSTSEPLSETALPSVGKDSPIVASGENDLDAFEQVPSSVAVSASHSPERSLADSPTVHLDGQGQEIEALSGNLLTPSSNNIMPDTVLSASLVLQPQPFQGAISADTAAESNKEDVVFVSTFDHKSESKAIAEQLAAALAQIEAFKQQAADQLKAAETLAQELAAERENTLMAKQETQKEKEKRLVIEGLRNSEDARLTQQALESLGANVVQPIQDMINDFEKKVVTPILASLEDLKHSFSENPEVDQSMIASIRSNVEHIQETSLKSIQSVIDTFRSTLQESKPYLLEPTALLAKAHELVEQIVMAFKDSASPQKPSIGSSVAPFEILQHFSYGPGIGLASTQIGIPLSFALIPQESTLLSAVNQTGQFIPTLGTASTSSSVSESAALTGLPNTRGFTPSVGTTIQALSRSTQDIPASMNIWKSQMNRQFQTFHESVNKMTALHKITKIRNRKNTGILIPVQA